MKNTTKFQTRSYLYNTCLANGNTVALFLSILTVKLSGVLLWWQTMRKAIFFLRISNCTEKKIIDTQ